MQRRHFVAGELRDQRELRTSQKDRRHSQTAIDSLSQWIVDIQNKGRLSRIRIHYNVGCAG